MLEKLEKVKKPIWFCITIKIYGEQNPLRTSSKSFTLEKGFDCEWIRFVSQSKSPY